MVISISTHFFLYTTFASILTDTVTSSVCVGACVRSRAYLTCYLCRPKEIGRDLLRYVTGVSVMDSRDILTVSLLFPSTFCAYLHVYTACLANSLWKRDQTLSHVNKIRRKLSTTCLPVLKARIFPFVNNVQSFMEQDLPVVDGRHGWYSILCLLCVWLGKVTNEHNHCFAWK